MASDWNDDLVEGDEAVMVTVTDGSTDSGTNLVPSPDELAALAPSVLLPPGILPGKILSAAE